MTTTNKRKVEVLTAGCPACDEAVALVKSLACDSCDVEVLDMKQPNIAERARGYGIRSVPPLSSTGSLQVLLRPGHRRRHLRAEGIGQPTP